MAFLSIVFYTLAVLLRSERAQARPGRPQFPSSTEGCNVPGDRLYPLGAVIFKDPNGCHEFICTKAWDTDFGWRLCYARNPNDNSETPNGLIRIPYKYIATTIPNNTVNTLQQPTIFSTALSVALTRSF
ncbi:hypothetical protein ACROYT_G008475 [Oculina patagonica]